MDFAFFRGPIDTPSGAEGAFAAYGRAAAAWARLEQHIDAVLIQINREAHSQALYESDHPVSFEKKIELLKRWFNQHPPLAEFKTDIRDLTSRLKVLAKDGRNLMFHSIIWHYEPTNQALMFKNIKPERNSDIRVREFSFTASDLNGLADLMNTGNRYLGTVSLQLFTPEWLERLQRP